MIKNEVEISTASHFASIPTKVSNLGGPTTLTSQQVILLNQ